jgi:hypothetical protein
MPQDPTETLLAAFRQLAPWRSDSDFTRDDWEMYINAARLLQKSDPQTVARALVRFLDEAHDSDAVKNETRVFLLLRLVFDLPTRAPVPERRVFKGWTNWPDPDSEGSVNLSWPVSLRAGRPRLLARYEGSDGPRYGAVEEYRYLLARYPFRSLAGK